MKVYLIRRTDDPYEPDDVHGVFRERLDAVVMSLDSAHHSLQPPALADSLGNLCSRNG